jgi:hypothetical protein
MVVLPGFKKYLDEEKQKEGDFSERDIKNN